MKTTQPTLQWAADSGMSGELLKPVVRDSDNRELTANHFHYQALEDGTFVVARKIDRQGSAMVWLANLRSAEGAGLACIYLEWANNIIAGHHSEHVSVCTSNLCKELAGDDRLGKDKPRVAENVAKMLHDGLGVEKFSKARFLYSTSRVTPEGHQPVGLEHR